MLKIHPIPAFTDNYIWAIINETAKQAIIIDAGQAAPAFNFLTKNNLDLTAIWVTHHHNDHIGGVAILAEKYPNAQVFAHTDVLPQIGLKNPAQGVIVGESSEFTIWADSLNLPVQVWQVAGHTQNHLAYLLTFDDNLHVFCGDTLFSAGCGRVFTGTIEQLFESFDRFNDLHDDKTLFYPAHEYTLSNLKFAEFIEPDNAQIKLAIEATEQLRKANKPTLPTMLAHERAINPFLKIIHNPDDNALIEGVKAKFMLDSNEPLVIFTALRQLKDKF